MVLVQGTALAMLHPTLPVHLGVYLLPYAKKSRAVAPPVG